MPRDIRVIFRREIERTFTSEARIFGSNDTTAYHDSILKADIRPHDRRPRKVKLMKLKLLYQSY